MAFSGFLGEHTPAVEIDFEHTAGGLNQANLSVGVRLVNLGRQTGGPWLVVSDDAEFDRDRHGVNDSRA